MATSYCNSYHILVGLGGTGGKILKAFKMRMFEEFPDPKERNKQSVALLYVDSTDEMMGIGRPDFRVMGLDASFTQNEFLYIKDVDVTKILDNIDNYPAVKGIVSNVSAVKTAIGSLGQAAGQKRRAGRLLFAANAVAYVNALKDAYSRCDAVSHNAEKTNIHIFAGLCGGTGSGSIIDAIVQARKTFPEAIISVYAMIPEMHLPKANMDQGRYYQNGYAALNELNALQSNRFCPHDVTSANRVAKLFSDKVKGVADGLTLYSNVNENGLSISSLDELPKLVSDYVYARVFLINSTDSVNHDCIRAYTYENMDDFAYEYDETKNPDANNQIPIARTKKINSFGIKRVIYPELRVLKHITYTVGQKVLYQFKYNNWRDELGFIDEEPNVDYRQLFFRPEHLSDWKLDMMHLTLEKKILESDTDYPTFREYWHDKAIDYAEDAKATDNPLNELDDIMASFYEKQFRKDGVVKFYEAKKKVLPEMSKEIRKLVEKELFEKWKVGDISTTELVKIGNLLMEYINDIRKEINAADKKAQSELQQIADDRQANVTEWSHKSLLSKKLLGGNTNSFTEHQEILTDYYTTMTQIEALAFARDLAARLFIDLGKLVEEISGFGQRITEALDETNRLIAAQAKVNKGLEDMRGAIIEVSEDEQMVNFETTMNVDKANMTNIARQIRESIIPDTGFSSFGDLTSKISIKTITNAFDVKLSEVVKIKHEELIDQRTRVLGLNILTQLRQKLRTYEDIQRFAMDIVKQSGVYLLLNNDQMQIHVRNNEGNLSPSNPASINKKTILVSIPSPEKDDDLKSFADDLEKAFKSSFAQGSAQTSIVINKKSPRTDELSIITIAYCFPMRAISWMTPYKEKYEDFLHTGNAATDVNNAILLHSEGDGSQLPSIFVVPNAEQIAAKEATMTAANAQPQGMPEMPPMPGELEIPQIPVAEPEVNIYLSLAGKRYGPYNYATCKQLVQNKQMTEQSLVWQQGMTAWLPAGQVKELAALFAPEPPMPPMPDMPPMPEMPPMPPTV